MRLVLAAAFVFAAGPALAATGQEVFNDNCSECHTLAPPSATAPALQGVFGRPIASLKDFQYSDALKAKHGVWTEQALDAFLANPQVFAPGTAMYGSAADPNDRKAIIDFLKTAK